MNRIESYELLKEILIDCLEDEVSIKIEGNDFNKDIIFELLEFCREQLDK